MMFIKKHGRNHAICGLFYLIWIIVGFSHEITIFSRTPSSYLLFYDIIFGCLGILLPLTAAADFKHNNVENIASGTLDAHATVSHGEMIEHSFYQGLNLIQVIYLHIIALDHEHEHDQGIYYRYLLVLLATSPWALRSSFPVNKFSDNYMKIDEKSNWFIRFLYRIKKYQYMFYKHFLLHGLNFSVALSPLHAQLVKTDSFRLYWMLLNTSYVMEFFLQTLVKKQYITQRYMLGLQLVLMTSASIAAVKVLEVVKIPFAIISLILNFINRKHDVMNSIMIMTLAVCYHQLIAV